MPNHYHTARGPGIDRGCVCRVFIGLLAASSNGIAQQPAPSQAGPSTLTTPIEQFVCTFTSPQTGKQYDRYLVYENVPMPKLEQEEKRERRLVPQWVTETVKLTETRYIPYWDYQLQQRMINQWNIFAQPQVAWEWVPVQRYQPDYQVVDRQVPVVRYVEQEVPIIVPKLVQATEQRAKYVDRERTVVGVPSASPPATTAASGPIQSAADLAMANRNTTNQRYGTRPMDAWYGGLTNPPTYYGNPYAYSPSNAAYGASTYYLSAAPMTPPMQLASGPTNVPPVSSGYAYPPPLPVNAYSSAPVIKWPSWTFANGPLLQQDWFRQNQSYGYGSSYPATSTSYPMVANQSSVAGAIRPSTAPVMPQNGTASWGSFGTPSTYRDPLQAGIPATELR